MESFGIQLFIFSIITAMVVVFVLVYNLTRKMLGNDTEYTITKNTISTKRPPVTRDSDNTNSNKYFHEE